jgi:hypothetical protein
MKYAVKNFKIKSNWFDEDGKFKKMNADTLYLYFSLFKFRIYGQENDYMFMTSIYHLRKETGFTKSKIFEQLKQLIKLNIVTIVNVRRWDRFFSSKGVPEKNILEIIAIDIPKTQKIKDESGNTTDKPETENDYYVSVETQLLEQYRVRGLNHKYYPIYCLIKKLQNGNVEKKSFMSIEKMALWLGYDKDYLHKLIQNMNRKYVLFSDLRDNGKGSKYFEHHLLKIDQDEQFLNTYKLSIERNIKKWDKKKRNGKRLDEENFYIEEHKEEYNPFL